MARTKEMAAVCTDLKGKVERQVEIKSDGDVFHELFRYKPDHISTISPDNIHGVDLHEGDWGNDDSIITWNYTHDGKKKSTKVIVKTVDEETKTVIYNVIEGDLTDLYKDFKATVHVDTKGESNTVTWTFEYEKLNVDVEDPNTLMDFIIKSIRISLSIPPLYSIVESKTFKRQLHQPLYSPSLF